MRSISFLCFLLLALPAAPARASDVAELERELTELKATVRDLEARLTALARGAPAPSGPAVEESALDRALREAEAEPAPTASAAATAPPGGARAPASYRLMDISLAGITSVGGSTATDQELPILEGGDHDPRQRGFNLQALELSFRGAIDPYLLGEASVVYFLDPEGESQFEIEEAFVTTQSLPENLQLSFGQMFTEFGRHNPTHAHAWVFVDQPVILSRLFGEDGMRNPGARLSWLPPTPWFSELSLGSQWAKGETMTSFLSSDEAFEGNPIAGFDFFERDTQSAGDLVWLVRLLNAFDVGETWTAQLGISSLFGPNASGSNADTQIFGFDAMAKWRPATHRRGWPFLLLEAEYAYRRYETDEEPAAFGTLRDWGGYAQALWGFRERLALGLRGEYASGSGNGVVPRSDDPFRQDRMRLSPLLAFYQSEFARWRLQYNYDRSRFLEGGGGAHSVWLVLDFGFGAHPAHKL